MKRCEHKTVLLAFVLAPLLGCYFGESQPSDTGVQVSGAYPTAGETAGVDTDAGASGGSGDGGGPGGGTSPDGGGGGTPDPGGSGGIDTDGDPTATGGGGDATGGAGAQDECVSGSFWTQGDEGSKDMYPGSECDGCHTEMDKGPDYIISGTIHNALHEPDDCFGVAGATVEILDANGDTYTMTTNSAGNFYLRPAEAPNFATPYLATVIIGGVRSDMQTDAVESDCAACHTAAGANDADGRIIGAP